MVSEEDKRIQIHETWMAFRREYHKVKEGHRPKITHAEVQELMYRMMDHISLIRKNHKKMDMQEEYLYGIEVHVEGKIWHLRDDFYEWDELEKLNKNIAYSRKHLPQDKFRIVKFKRIQANKGDDFS